MSTIPGFASAERNYENLADECCDCDECLAIDAYTLEMLKRKEPDE